MKKVAIIVTFLALIVGSIFLFLTGDALNELVKSKIEEVGKQVTEQTVTVESVEIKLFDGTGKINNVVLPNPEKYSADIAFSLKEITLAIDSASFATDLIVIDKIIINKPEAFVEFTQSGSSNIQDILDAIKRNSPKPNNEEILEKSDKPKTREPFIRVNHFVLANTALTMDLSKLDNKVYELTLADINLTNIGGDRGVPASKFGAELLKQALSSIWVQAKKEQKEKLKEQFKNKIKDKLKGFIDSF